MKEEERRLASLIDRLVVEFPECSREQVERVTSAAWVVFGSTAANVHARVRVAEWYARTELAATDHPPSTS